MPFSEFSKCNLGECSLLPGDESSREREGGGGYLNGYVPPNSVVILERCRLLRNSVFPVVGTKMCKKCAFSLTQVMPTRTKCTPLFKTAFY